jgi:predicted MFS family arabinose efflux permease
MALLSRVASFAQTAQGSRQLKIFILVTLAMSAGYSVMDATFNNFLDANFTLTGFQRSFLELPRELPGFLTVFVSALLWFLCSRRLGSLSLALGAAGALLIGFASSSYAIMTVWLFIYSLGNHVMMPVTTTIGMELAEDGKTGQRLGQLNAVRNFAVILGSFLVFLGFRYLNFTFQVTFIIIAVALGFAAVLMLGMERSTPKPASLFLKLYPEYRLYYLLALLFGSRKQLFITFAPWVLVTIFKQPTQLLATLMTIGGVIGILFQPLLGRMIDRLGERAVLASEAVLLVFVCFGYGFARDLLPEATAFLVVCACFLLDQMLLSVSMARSTFMKKIARDPAHIQPSLTMAITIDHVFSILAALVGGLLWTRFGFQYVFLMGAGIALVNLFVALQVKVPASPLATPQP